ncbi:MAG: hypothetical protein Fur0025_01610 [Oscillatoriaceae cyanobacterium]
MLLPHEYPDISQMVLEDDTPLDSFFNEKQQRLLTTVFYSGADTGITVPFLAAANVGLFPHVRHTGIAPDVFLSLNITAGEDWWRRGVRSYLFWEFGKPPEVVIEIVSPTPGNELGSKLTDYANLDIEYYVVYDPLGKLGHIPLRVFELQGGTYVPKTDAWFPKVGLGLTLWEGEFEDVTGTWLRWCYGNGTVIPTGDELAAKNQVQLSQAETQLSQAEAQLSQTEARLAEEMLRRKQTLLQGIELGLRLKFGNDGVAMLAEMVGIFDVNLLEEIFSALATVNSLDELRLKLYRDPGS